MLNYNKAWFDVKNDIEKNVTEYLKQYKTQIL